MPEIYENYSNQFELFQWWIGTARLFLSDNVRTIENYDYWQEWEVFLDGMQVGVDELEQKLSNFKKTPNNRILSCSLDVGVSSYLHNVEKAKNLRMKADSLTHPLSPMQLSMIDGLTGELLCISERDSRLIGQYKIRSKAFDDQLEQLGHDLRELKLFSKPLSIFIWHSQQKKTDIHRQRIRHLAGYLEKVGFDVKLDIIHNEAGSGPGFSDHINGQNKTDAILVICTPDVPKLKSGIAVHHELDRIAHRDQSESNCIFPVILRGNHDKSVPGFLQPRKTDALNLSNSVTYVCAFFNLIRALYLNNTEVVKLTKQAYKSYLVHQSYESPELEDSLLDESHAAASSSQPGSAEYQYSGGPELETAVPDTSSFSQRSPGPGRSATASSSCSSFFYQPEPTDTPPRSLESPKLPFG